MDSLTTSAPDAGARPLRTLLVEDCEDDALLILRELRKEGLRTAWRRVDTRSALEDALDRGRWDLVICDHLMPGFSSMEALEVVRGRGLDLPFLIVSGAAPEDLVAAAMRRGAHDFIAKDHLVRLAPAVRRELREARLRRERKGMESRLVASETRTALLVAAVAQVADAIVIADRDGTVAYANHAFEVLAGGAPEAIQGRNLAELLDHPDLVAAMARAAAGQVWRGRLSLPDRGRETREVDLTCSPVRDPDRAVRNLVVVVRDLTKEVELERELRQAQKMDALGVLAAGIAHDFNNVLTTILASAELMQCRIPSDSPLLPKVQTILRAGRDAAGLTRQVLAFSRKGDEKRVPLDFTTLVRDVLGALRATLPANVDLGHELTSGIWVEGDPAQLQQMVMNLVINGIQAMKPRGGRLTVALGEVVQDPAPRQARLVVSDTGCGMDPQVQERIFEPFFTTKPAGEGTGLGLAMVHTTVKKAGGSIQVESAPGRGTSFRILLPCATGGGSAARATQAREARSILVDAACPRARILLAEAGPDRRAPLRSWLQRAGYDVRTASDGLKAWEAFTRPATGQPFDLLLTDVALPRMDGLELIQLVRKEDPAIAIGVLGGDENQELVKDLVGAALHLGVDELVRTPAGSEDALASVAALLAKRTARLDQQRSQETAQAVRQAQKSMAAAPEQGVPLYTLYEPLADAGGDLFRCFKGGDGTVLFVVADVAGHSVLSSYAVASFLGMLSSRAAECLGLAAASATGARDPLQRLADQLNRGIQTSPFSDIPVCALLGLWSPASGRVRLLNAGIPHGLHYCRRDRHSAPVPLNGNPLGVFPEPDLEGTDLRLAPGDRLLFGTDGFFEARSPARACFQEAAAAHWDALADSPLDWALSAICETARIHCGGTLTDDLLVMGFEQPGTDPAPDPCTLRIPSTTRAVDLACERFRAALKEPSGTWRAGPERRFDIVLAVREALTNAVIHGNRERPEVAVLLRWRLEAGPRGLVVSVSDQGPGFDLAAQVPPVDPLAEHGRGLALIRFHARTVRMDGGTLTMTFASEEESHDQR
jgi:hypothetical protein